MCNTKIGSFCQQHSDWSERPAQEPYNLKIKEDGPYVMFSYDQIRSNFNIELVREARGIIFRKGEWDTPVCWAFNKFGNYGESYATEIDWDTAFVTEKIDGSLMKIWWDGDWHISTNGCIDVFKAELNNVNMPDFGYYFLEALGKYYNSFGEFVAGLETHRTYMFELVGPYNRVVVPYDEPDLYFLDALEEVDEVVKRYIFCEDFWKSCHNGNTPRLFAINLAGHGCILIAKDVAILKELQKHKDSCFVQRSMPEFM